MRAKFYDNYLSNKLNFFATIDIQKAGIILSSEIDKIGDLVNSYFKYYTGFSDIIYNNYRNNFN